MKTGRVGAVCCAGVLLLGLITVGTGMAPRVPSRIVFPSDFLFGAATSAHQVEGNNTNNDWYEWEQLGKTVEPSGIAADHYNRYAGDFTHAAELGHTAQRISLEWSRIEPNQGVFSSDEIAHYRDVLKTLKDKGQKTFLTLHHFTNPIWAAKLGGWSNPEMPLYFASYVSHVVPALGDLVDFWITVNEPNVTALTGYFVGATPPGLQDKDKFGQALANFLKGHALAYRVIHQYYPDAKVGIAHHMRVFSPARWWHPFDIFIAQTVDHFWNDQILRSIKKGKIKFYVPLVFSYEEDWPSLKGTLDFVGVNYYTRERLMFDFDEALLFRRLDGDDPHAWQVYPKGIYRMLQRAGSYGLPVYITENGIADANDEKRADFICSHLEQIYYAMEEGIDVRGYLHWSLMDNFEWVHGFGPRFGLLEVDYLTQERKVRPSAELFKKIIQSRSLDDCGRV